MNTFLRTLMVISLPLLLTHCASKEVASEAAIDRKVAKVEEIAEAQVEVPAKDSIAIAATDAVKDEAKDSAVQTASLVAEVEGHLKKDEDSVSYKTVYLEVDKPKLFKGGFRNFSKDCNMRLRADKGGEVVGTVGKGKRLWVDDHSETWAKVYRNNGPAYIFKGCL